MAAISHLIPAALALQQAWWEWLLFSDGGTMARVAVGVTILAIIALVDLHKKGSEATRWREYLFLAAAAGVAMVYGAINDQITSLISWEFWWYGKGLETMAGKDAQSTGPAAGFHWAVHMG